MSKQLSIELSDEVYTAVQKRAEQSGRSPAELVAATLERQFGPNGAPTPAASQAKGRFRRHFGAVNLGHPTGADNEQIDADLTKEYGNNHEDQ